MVQTSTKQTVGEYLDKDTYARDNWFPVNKILNRKTLSEGAMPGPGHLPGWP